MPRSLKYYPQWDLFPLNRIVAGAGIKMGTEANKKLVEYLWFWREKYRTMIVQQQSYICHDMIHITKRA